MGHAWPDWSGQLAVVIAAGASARDTVARMGTWRPRTIAINRSHELAPWADMLYAADGAFWHEYPAARAFAGIKATASDQAARFYGLHHVTVEPYGFDAPVIRGTAHVGHGGHSTFQAINLAAQLGASPLVLVGVDLCGQHWHEPHGANLLTAADWYLAQWAEILDEAASVYAAHNIAVLNASQRSALTAFPKVDIAAIKERAAA